MAKKKEIKRIAKLQFNAGQSKPGPELAGLGIVMPEFTKAFNDETRDRNGEPVPVTITIYADKSFTFKTHTAPTSYKLLQAAGLKKGSENAKTTKVATIKKEQVKEIAEYKLPDLNTNDIKAAMNIVAGTAKNMGILIDGMDDVEAEKEAAKEAVAAAAAADAKEAALEAAEAEAKDNKEFVEAEAINGVNDEEKEGDE
ncbi:MAG: 50S ribosomal protein L11 [Mycoplasmatales bacterium]|nr:50S ribosomal protein L11 [Mycoplasmatales bacterium]